MPTDLKDPKPGMTYFEAASILAATQVAYGRFNANPEDWTYALYQLDTSARTLSTIRSSRLHVQFRSSIGGGNYHALQVNLKKRFGNGDSVDMNYTFSKVNRSAL